MRMAIVGSRLTAIFFLMGTLLPWTGCGSNSGPSVPQFKIHGKVLSHGEPAAGAIVALHSVNKSGAVASYPPRGVAGKDGAFVIGSRMKDDGAPEGEYAVTIVWPEAQDAQKQFDNTPPDRLKNRYNDVKNPKWRVRVNAGDNTLEPFALD